MHEEILKLLAVMSLTNKPANQFTGNPGVAKSNKRKKKVQGVAIEKIGMSTHDIRDLCGIARDI